VVLRERLNDLRFRFQLAEVVVVDFARTPDVTAAEAALGFFYRARKG